MVCQKSTKMKSSKSLKGELEVKQIKQASDLPLIVFKPIELKVTTNILMSSLSKFQQKLILQKELMNRFRKSMKQRFQRR
jgi:hypothetical protein